MKRMISVASLILLANLNSVMPSDSYAGMSPDTNEIGIYADPAGDVDSVNVLAIPGVPFHAYLVLTKPVNHSFNGGTDTNIPVTLLKAWECRVNKPAGLDSNWFQISETLQHPFVNVGTQPDYVVGFADPLVVSGNAVVLIDWEIMVADGGTYEWYLGLTENPSIPGTLAYADDNDSHVGWPNYDLESAYPSSGDFSLPVFTVNGQAVHVEAESWGGVKALFR